MGNSESTRGEGTRDQRGLLESGQRESRKPTFDFFRSGFKKKEFQMKFQERLEDASNLQNDRYYMYRHNDVGTIESTGSKIKSIDAWIDRNKHHLTQPSDSYPKKRADFLEQKSSMDNRIRNMRDLALAGLPQTMPGDQLAAFKKASVDLLEEIESLLRSSQAGSSTQPDSPPASRPISPTEL
jgi:uncharacterized protein Yka (UPF0111/DUF47 family)